MTTKPRGRVLLAISGYDPHAWQAAFEGKRDAVLETANPNDPTINYALVWRQDGSRLKSYPNLRAIFSVGAGVDHLLADPTLPDVPIVRVVDHTLTQPMVEYIVWRVLDHLRQGLLYRQQQKDRLWYEPAQPQAGEVTVGIMGLGELGTAAAQALLALNFNVNGWSRRPKDVAGVTTFHGQSELGSFLASTDILVVLLPLTPDTKGIIDTQLLSGLRRDNPLGGAVLINAGRGGLQKDADILQALDASTLKEATLDVFETEPLPAQSPMWSHPKVFVTPHAAATSDPARLVPPMIEQMDAFERGEPLRNLVDRKAGY
ncbi:MAG: glyoxylate/hydroxypyruvate reductase A [Rhizobiaceae bacterium]